MTTTLTEIQIRSPDCVARMYAERARDLQIERLWVLTLRYDHTIIGDHTIRDGAPGAVRFKPREILRNAIVDQADVIVMVHNHPSGIPSPSDLDLLAWDQMKEACKTVGIRLLDSVIIAGDAWFSFVNDYEKKVPA